MKTQNNQTMTATQTENNTAHRSFLFFGTKTYSNVKRAIVNFNKNLSVYGAAAASAIRN
ncbi:hypothetical protein [Ascidiimonas sp. W6]|uniref:hypothetical protein n=1 Tax=Ascidiimonas meishanensis TaxID=3128903 RepID=UPI0030ED5609